MGKKNKRIFKYKTSKYLQERKILFKRRRIVLKFLIKEIEKEQNRREEVIPIHPSEEL